jgi:hypothetical protein
MAIVFKFWLSVIELFILILLGVFIAVNGIVVLSLPDMKTTNILSHSIQLTYSNFALDKPCLSLGARLRATRITGLFCLGTG